jgi:Nucleotidyl transferase AbiEii toxin, Type IV TA system
MTPAIEAWLRLAARDDQLVLRGSVLMRALSPRGRMPADVDHVVLGELTLDAVADRVRALVADGELSVASTEVIWAESVTPAVRVMLDHASGPLQIDLVIRESMSLPPAPIAIAGIPIACARPEDLFGWKCHGLVEYGHGQWRAKDIYDLDVLGADVALDAAALRPAVALAFATRGSSPALLDDFLDRPAWGESRGGRRRWRDLARTVAVDEFAIVRERVRAVVSCGVR